ncbi:unnamed protein product [Caenorhabditis brenneri]
MPSPISNKNVYFPYDYNLLTAPPLRPRRKLGDTEIDRWVNEDKEIVQFQWEMLKDDLNDLTGTDESCLAILNWDLSNAVDEEDDESSDWLMACE